MTEKVGSISYEITLDMSQLISAEREVARRLGRVGAEGDKLQTKFTAIAAGISAALSAIAIESLVSKLVSAQRQFDVMFASLKTVTGGVDQASSAWERLTKFAAETPYSLEQSVEGFVKLKALGLDPSERSMRSFGNTASAMGKSLMQMIEAVADASTGEFERLKEFGITASTQGNKVAFTFQGVTTTVKKSASDIKDYLMKIGEVNFAGAMSERMNTLDGDISNLDDSVQSLFRTVMQSGFGDLIRTAAQDANKAISELTTSIKDGGLTDFFSTMRSILPAVEVAVVSLSGAMTARLVVAFIAVAEKAAWATAAMVTMNTTVGTFGALMTALGGPIGIAITATALLALNWDKLGFSAKNAADITTESASRIAAAIKKSGKAAETDLSSQLAETEKNIKKLKESRSREKVSYTGPASDDVIAGIDEKLDAYEKARANIKAAMNGLGGGGGRGTINPDLVTPAAPDKVDPKQAAEDAKYLAQLRVRATQDAIKQINLEEQAALADNQERMIKGEVSEKAAQEARTLIAQQFIAKRQELKERDAESAASANIAMTLGEEQKILAVREEAMRKASALEKMGVITHKEAEREKAVATFEATQRLNELVERLTQTQADTKISAATTELAKIDMIRQEAYRRADAAVRSGAITFAQAEADKAKAAVDAQNAIRQTMASVNPLGQLEREYQDKLAIVQFYEQQMAKAGVDATAFGEQKRAELATQFTQQRQQLAESEFAMQSNGNKFLMDSLNAMSSTATSSIMGLINGTMTAQDAMRGLASTILNEAVGSLVQIGVQYIKNAMIADTVAAADTARKAANGTIYAASVSAQVAGMSSIAAMNAFAATAAIPIVGPALAPEAAAVAAATATGLGAPAIATAPIAGARQYGGPVSADSLYRVNESGKSEMFVAGNGSQYLMPTANGKVVPADQVGVRAAPTVIIQNLGAPLTVKSQSFDEKSNTLRLLVGEIAGQIRDNTGPVWSALKSSTNVQSRL